MVVDPELTQLRERIRALQVELAKHRHSSQVLETTETNLHLFARGLAHDFNNLLTGILGHAALIQSADDAGAESREAAGVIYKAAERASELAGQLMNFTRGGIGRALPVDVHDTVREVAELPAAVHRAGHPTRVGPARNGALRERRPGPDPPGAAQPVAERARRHARRRGADRGDGRLLGGGASSRGPPSG